MIAPDERMYVFGLIGEDTSRSLSPRIHTIAMEIAGIRGVYRTFPAKEQELEKIVKELRGSSLTGVNVTIPYKEKVIRFLDGLSEEAREIGAVNTIKKENGRLIGYNTDSHGFLQALADMGFTPSGRKVLVLGSGGAARAVCHGLVQRGVASLTIASRSLEKAEVISETSNRGNQDLGCRSRALHDPALRAVIEDADLIVNTTPLGSGTHPGRSPLPTDSPLHAGQVVVDVVYEPADTPLLLQARAAGADTLGGMRMLVHQALESLRIWLEAQVDARQVLDRL